MAPPAKKRVLIVGAGAAGMSCADSLAQHTDRFDVTLIGELPHRACLVCPSSLF